MYNAAVGSSSFLNPQKCPTRSHILQIRGLISNQERSGAHIDNSGSSITFYLSVAHLDHEGACTQVTNAIESLFNVECGAMAHGCYEKNE